MCFEESEFEFGGGDPVRRLVVRQGADLALTPAPYSSLLTQEHKSLFKDPAEYFRQLAGDCNVPEMQSWLLELAATESCELEINLHEMFGWEIVVRVGTFMLQLRCPVDLPPGTEQLNALYDVVAGTYEFGYGEGGGLCLPIDVSDYGWWYADDERVRDGVVFYSGPHGEVYAVANDTVFWCGDDVVVIGNSVGKVLDQYFGQYSAGDAKEFWYPAH